MTDISVPVGQVAADLAALGIHDVDLKAFGFGRKKPKFDPDQHPRDREGKFIEKGGTVKLRAGGTAEVLDTVGAGRIRVRRDDDGREVVLDSGLVTQTETGDERSKRRLSEIDNAWDTMDYDQAVADGRIAPAADGDAASSAAARPDSGARDETATPSPLSADTVVAAGPGGGTGRAMTDQEFEARQAYVADKTDAAIKAGLSTDAQFSLDGKGKVWTRERAMMHAQIVQEVMDSAADVPNQGKAVFSGGLGGAGKGTILKNPVANIDKSQYLTLNPDDIKEILAARGLVPDVPDAPDLSPMERSTLIHEESSHITQLIAQQAYAQRKNIVWDITMASEKSVNDRLTALRQARYVESKAIFVDIPVEVSVTRALGRWRKGQDRYETGENPIGGRFVPPDIIRKGASASFSSANRTNFETLRDSFDDWQVWDNSVDGRPPRLVYEKSSPNLAELTGAAREGLTDFDRLELKSMPGTAAVLYLTLRRKGLPHSGQRHHTAAAGGSHP